ncbi:peptidylprolyl isomerase [Roseovarius sp. A21]|uniref:Parvulin-like PPIase n=1 Tax=Roseovarius bejariae TaxID=2576383 RepID=A0A844CK76_9RHOB|nr:peptidylprolyl isomerase [Roseovarius bejariae]MRU15731.1 peptidylprolyl isomerase [Roseovarius bejariae]
MLIRPSFFSAAALALGLATAAPATAQDAPDPETVVATVDGTDITLGHMIALRSSLPQQYNQLPPEVLFNGILEQLVQQTLLMQDFEGELSRQAELLIENERRAVIAGEVITDVMGGDLDAEAVQAAYDEKYGSAEEETEYRAAHILVETEEEAKALIEELEGGADFTALAQEKSVGPSGANGGDLGWFGEGTMVESFFNAVTELEVGALSAPVQTQFGWHVIKLNETRIKEQPSLDEVRAQLEEELRQAAFEEHVKTLEAGAEIERADTSGIDPTAINDMTLLED